MNDIEEILELIKLTRKEKGLSQKEMGELLGITQGSYASLELGKTSMKLDQFIKLVNHLNIEFGSKDDPKEQSLITLDPNSIASIFMNMQNEMGEVKKQNEEILRKLDKLSGE